MTSCSESMALTFVSGQLIKELLTEITSKFNIEKCSLYIWCCELFQIDGFEDNNQFHVFVQYFIERVT